jgi:hypothetical protein
MKTPIKKRKSKSRRGGNRRGLIKTNKTKKNASCSPASSLHKITPQSCFTEQTTIEMKNAYNEENPMSSIHAETPQQIIRSLKDRHGCREDRCLVNQIKNKKVRENIEKHIFLPKQPPEWKKKPNEWLSNFDILDVLRQYEEAFPAFHFIGPVPIDFDKALNGSCVAEELCSFRVEVEKSKQKTQIGIIFNLDKHDEPGSHWVSMYMDLEDSIIYYFDSASTEVPPEIAVLNDRIIRENPEFTFLSNRVEHQRGNTECGMYSLYFIIHMLLSKNRKRLFQSHFNSGKHKITDKQIQEYRNIYFSSSSSS